MKQNSFLKEKSVEDISVFSLFYPFSYKKGGNREGKLVKE